MGYETLVTSEEMFRSEDKGSYFCIPADACDLNYDKFFVEEQEDISKVEDYNSHNTYRLNVEEMKLPEVKEDIEIETKINSISLLCLYLCKRS